MSLALHFRNFILKCCNKQFIVNWTQAETISLHYSIRDLLDAALAKQLTVKEPYNNNNQFIKWENNTPIKTEKISNLQHLLSGKELLLTPSPFGGHKVDPFGHSWNQHIQQTLHHKEKVVGSDTNHCSVPPRRFSS